MHENLNNRDVNEYSPLVLAYIGDAVYELLVRTQNVSGGTRRIKDIHHDTVEIVKAGHQARIIHLLLEELTPEEQNIVRRGRNTRSSPPRNADRQDYRMSTGFEALLGYLYLKGDEKRLRYLFSRTLELE